MGFNQWPVLSSCSWGQLAVGQQMADEESGLEPRPLACLPLPA